MKCVLYRVDCVETNEKREKNVPSRQCGSIFFSFVTNTDAWNRCVYWHCVTHSVEHLSQTVWRLHLFGAKKTHTKASWNWMSGSNNFVMKNGKKIFSIICIIFMSFSIPFQILFYRIIFFLSKFKFWLNKMDIFHSCCRCIVYRKSQIQTS